MYSKPPRREDESLRIPENYSGNAFFGESLPPPSFVDDGTESPPKKEPSPFEELSAENIPTAEAAPSHDVPALKQSPFSSFLPPKIAGARGGLLGDIGVEELLIIGVIILLSQSETDDDILLLLLLLLFYK